MLKLCGFAYVNDSDLIEDGATAEETLARMQNGVNLWEELIKATGGVMAPHKSWWYLVDFIWKKGKWTFRDAGAGKSLSAHDATGTVHNLTYLLPSEVTKILGVYMALISNDSKQVQYLKEKTSKWGDIIRAGHLSPTEAYLMAITTIWKTIEYPLATLNLSQAELKTITWPVYKASYKKMGVHQ